MQKISSNLVIPLIWLCTVKQRSLSYSYSYCVSLAKQKFSRISFLGFEIRKNEMIKINESHFLTLFFLNERTENALAFENPPPFVVGYALSGFFRMLVLLRRTSFWPYLSMVYIFSYGTLVTYMPKKVCIFGCHSSFCKPLFPLKTTIFSSKTAIFGLNWYFC